MQTVDSDASPIAFRALALEIRAAGLLDRRPAYYAAKIALTVMSLAAGWAALFVVGNSWAALGVAAFLGAMFTQLGFIGHDAGHQQVFRSRRANRTLGLVVGDALIGVSFGWWVPKHDAHHAHPNQVGRDPDVGEGLVPSSKLGRPLASWQAGLFFPLMILRSLGLHVSGAQRLLRQRDRAAALETLILALHFTLYFGMVLWALSPLKAVAFVAVQQVVFSVYLGCSFAPNHKGMPLLPGDVEMSFLQRQVVTARNVSGGPLTTLLLGGLNYQIEHHLFPAMPRPNLALAQKIIRAFCVRAGLSYCEESLFGSYRRTLRYLRTAGERPLLTHRPEPAPVPTR